MKSKSPWRIQKSMNDNNKYDPDIIEPYRRKKDKFEIGEKF